MATIATIATKDAVTSLCSVDVYPEVVETDSDVTVLRFSHVDLDRLGRALDALGDDWDRDDSRDESGCENCEELEDMLGGIRAILG